MRAGGVAGEQQQCQALVFNIGTEPLVLYVRACIEKKGPTWPNPISTERQPSQEMVRRPLSLHERSVSPRNP